MNTATNNSTPISQRDTRVNEQLMPIAEAIWFERSDRYTEQENDYWGSVWEKLEQKGI